MTSGLPDSSIASICLSTAQRGEQLDQLAVQHRCIHRGEVPWDHLIMGPVFGTWFLMQIGDSTSPNIYKNGDLPNKNSDLNVFFIKKQRNVHISNFWCQICVPFQYPPTWDILGTPLTGNLIATYNPWLENTFDNMAWFEVICFFPMGSVFAFQGPRKKQSKTNKKEKHEGDATSLSGSWFGTFFIFPYIGNNHPNWRNHIFQRGGTQPPTSYWLVQNAIFHSLGAIYGNSTSPMNWESCYPLVMTNSLPWKDPPFINR